MGILAMALTLSLASSGDDQTVAGRSLAVRGAKEYAAGQYEEAARDLLAAFQLVPVPILLFNLGQCENALGHLDRAIHFYESYLAASPEGPDVAVARERLREALALKAQRGQATPTATPTATATATATPAPTATPTPTEVAPAEAVTEAPSPAGHSHWLGATLVAAAAVCAGFAIVGAVRVVQYDQITQYGQALPVNANADNWATAAIVLGIAAAGGAAGAILTW
jgi:tetratricopeptide (TPR) repeat protein